MPSWLLDEGLEGVSRVTAQGDEDWEQDAWETDETPDWAEEEDWEDEEEDDDDDEGAEEG